MRMELTRRPWCSLRRSGLRLRGHRAGQVVEPRRLSWLAALEVLAQVRPLPANGHRRRRNGAELQPPAVPRARPVESAV